MILTSIAHEEKIFDEKTVTKDDFKCGRYHITRLKSHYSQGFDLISFRIKKTDNDEYLPNILYVDDEHFDNPDGSKWFGIETQSLVTKGTSEMRRFVEGYNEAIEVVDILTKNFAR